MKSAHEYVSSGVEAPKGLYKIRLFVSDMEASLQFYSDILGIRVAWKEEDNGRVSVAALEIGDTEVVLVVPGEAHALPTGVPRGLGMALYLEVSDIHRWFERVVQRGCTPLSPTTFKPVRRPVRRPWGETVFALCDPDGYHVRLCMLW